MTCHPRALVAERDAQACVPGPCYPLQGGEQAGPVRREPGSFNDVLSQELKWERGLEGGPGAQRLPLPKPVVTCLTS